MFDEYSTLRLKNSSGGSVNNSTLVYLTDPALKTFSVANPVTEAACNVIGMVQFAGSHNIPGVTSIDNGDWSGQSWK